VAREHGRILCSIWNDPAFVALDGTLQRAYFVLLSEQSINNAGVVAITLRRWSKLAPDTPEDDFGKHLRVLADHRFLVIDWDTEELLVRSFIRGDGVFKQPHVLLNAVRVAAGVRSPELRAALALELRRVNAAGRVLPKYRSEVEGMLSSLSPENPSRNPSPKGTENPSANPSEIEPFENPSGNPTGKGKGLSTAVGSPLVGGSVGEPSPAKSSPRRGSRISEPFELTDSMRSWATASAPDVDLATQTANFVDYWAAKPGKDGVKLDWTRTWQRWMRTEQGRTPSRSRNPATTGGRDPEDWLRDQWRAGRVSEIRTFYNIGYDEPAQRGDGDYWTDVLKPHNQAWITAHRDAILQRLKDRT
jgi:hypothetical protein